MACCGCGDGTWSGGTDSRTAGTADGLGCQAPADGLTPRTCRPSDSALPRTSADEDRAVMVGGALAACCRSEVVRTGGDGCGVLSREMVGVLRLGTVVGACRSAADETERPANEAAIRSAKDWSSTELVVL